MDWNQVQKDVGTPSENGISRAEGGRVLSFDEKTLVHELLELSGLDSLPSGWLDSALVVEMDDGGMGSLRFISSGGRTEAIEQVAEISFSDVDGVLVSVTLNANGQGVPAELDVWKTNFQPLVKKLGPP
ncbi:MAG: hypothetical protein JHC82_01720 [Stenotrophomonas sp.]|nr:hypothetical protein [Stenotrophomonas sp.]